MKTTTAEDLVQRLIDNRISREDLEVFLHGLDDEEKIKAYAAYLHHHFEEIMMEYAKKKEQEKKKEHKHP